MSTTSNSISARSGKTKTIVEVGLMLGLFAILDYIGIRLPINVAGGSVSLAMVPILLYGLLRGPKLGLLLGVLAGSLDMMIQPFFVHPVQFALDYPVAYGVVGLAGAFSPVVVRALRDKRHTAALSWAAVASVVAGALRLLSHFASGVVFFGSYAPEGQPVWIYSLTYNLSYIAPSVIASAVVLLAVLIPVARVVLADGQASSREA